MKTIAKNIIFKNKTFIYIGIVVILLTSCVSREKVVYYQNIDKNPELYTKQFKTTIQPDDLLMIVISAQDPTAASPYNLVAENSVTEANQDGGAVVRQQLYLVDRDGYVELPIIGRVKMGGRTKEEVLLNLYPLVSKGLKDPVINIRLMNFKITVFGEVRQPGIHKVNSERITLPEALSLSGDLTVYGMRNNIIITREVENKVESHRVDITKVNFINSEFYYLKQNDVVYVEPNKTMVKSSAVGTNISIYLTVASLLISTLAIILTNSK